VVTATTAARPLLRATGVEVALAGRSVLRGVALDVWAGEVLGLIGPNGAGKSTFLRAVTGVVPPTGGSIAIDGRPVTDFSRRELACGVAVVQQLPEAPTTMRVAELVLLGRNPHLGLLSRESNRDYAAVEAAMRRAGCEYLAERTLGTLSGGQRRRAFIARALAQEPQLLLLDEPTANLDVQAQCEILELLRTLAADGAGVLIVMHDLTMAAAYCDRLALLADGRVLTCGTPNEVVTAATVQEVYGDRVTVIHRNGRGAPIVVPAILEDEP
jgi:iron complex transport system ATP-binding protein